MEIEAHASVFFPPRCVIEEASVCVCGVFYSFRREKYSFCFFSFFLSFFLDSALQLHERRKDLSEKK